MGRKLNKKNEYYFNERSLQSVYWAGMFAARGSITADKDRLQLKVREDKEERLIKFIEHTQIENIKINTGSSIPGVGRKPVIQKRLIVISPQWKQVLTKLYNLPFHRTELYYPNLKDELELQAFLLGYLDAGAYIGYSSGSKTNWLRIFICGHLYFCNWAKYWIDNWVEEPEKVKAAAPRLENEKTKTSTLSITSYRALTLYNLLSKVPVDKSSTWGKELTAYIKNSEVRIQESE